MQKRVARGEWGVKEKMMNGSEEWNGGSGE